MTQQPEALRLAEMLIGWEEETTQLERQAAAELRRLHRVNAQLLEALEDMVEDYQYEASMNNPALLNARVAIAQAKGEA